MPTSNARPQSGSGRSQSPSGLRLVGDRPDPGAGVAAQPDQPPREPASLRRLLGHSRHDQKHYSRLFVRVAPGLVPSGDRAGRWGLASLCGVRVGAVAQGAARKDIWPWDAGPRGCTIVGEPRGATMPMALDSHHRQRGQRVGADLVSVCWRRWRAWPSWWDIWWPLRSSGGSGCGGHPGDRGHRSTTRRFAGAGPEWSHTLASLLHAAVTAEFGVRFAGFC